MEMEGNLERPSTLFQKSSSALFYGLSSIIIISINKIVLTNYRFPSYLFLGLGQMISTIVILFFARLFGLVFFPKLTKDTPKKIFPLPLIHVINLITGLGGTQKLNLPMFTALRRFSIFLTMIFEYFLLSTRTPYSIRLSVGLMILGSFIAAMYDLSFDAYGYTLIFISDIFTAANGVYMKKLLEAKDLGKYGLLYYNSLFMIGPMVLLAYYTGDIDQVYQYLSLTYFSMNDIRLTFIICLLTSIIFGFVLNYSIVLCTHHNSALTTNCVGPIKNLLVTYGSMIFGGDYIFQWTNFIGINVSVLGSILYTYTTFREKNSNDNDQNRLAFATEKIVSCIK